LLVKRGDAAVFQPAEPALRGGPKRTFPVEQQVIDLALAQPISRGVRGADLTVLEICDAALKKS
jgi:hypothetical protein